MAPFEVRLRQDADVLVVTPGGELDIATAEQVRDAVGQRPDGSGLVVDLSELDFADTSGIRLLVETMRESRAQGFAFTVVRGRPSVQRIFELAGLDGVLPFVGGNE